MAVGVPASDGPCCAAAASWTPWCRLHRRAHCEGAEPCTGLEVRVPTVWQDKRWLAAHQTELAKVELLGDLLVGGAALVTVREHGNVGPIVPSAIRQRDALGLDAERQQAELVRDDVALVVGHNDVLFHDGEAAA